MALKIDTKFKEKLTCASKNDMRKLTNFYQSTFESLKIGTFIGSFILSRKCMSLTFMGESYVMAMKNDAKFERT